MKRKLTAHAIERFQQRWRPEISLSEATFELERIMGEARPAKGATIKDDEIWTCDGIALVIRREKGQATCVTVLDRETSARYGIGGGVINPNAEEISAQLDESVEWHQKRVEEALEWQKSVERRVQEAEQLLAAEQRSLASAQKEAATRALTLQRAMRQRDVIAGKIGS